MAENSSWDQANRRQNMVWFGEIEKKLSKLSKTTFTYRSTSYLFYGLNRHFTSSFEDPMWTSNKVYKKSCEKYSKVYLDVDLQTVSNSFVTI
jgi:hypothetical protein